jgi:hypothetical protein
MNVARLAALLCLGVSAVYAAEPPATAIPGAQKPAPAAVAPAAPAISPAAPSAPSTPQSTAPKDTKPLSQSAQPAANTSKTKPDAAGGKRARADRLDLDTSVVTGNRELPKVLYIVPWKKADIGDLPAQPFNTLLDEVMTPVDRDVFRREVTYYGAIAAGTDAPSAGAAPPAGSTGSSEK